MKGMILILIVLILMTACAHGRTLYFPKPENGCAEIVVIREIAFTGGGMPWELMVDGLPIAAVRTGDYVKFQLPAGVHAVGSLTSSMSIPFECGEKYYFLLSPNSIFSILIIRLAESPALEMMVQEGYQELDPKSTAELPAQWAPKK